jgi:hypothetical protein
MKKLVAATLAFGAVMTAGAAFADTIQNGIGNTFVVTTAQGAVLHYYFNADGTYSATTPDGATITGAYEIADGQLCLTPAGGERACAAYVGDKNVGDSWTQGASDGSQISVTLQAGR